MMNLSFFCALCALHATGNSLEVPPSSTPLSTPEPRPNIILILTDDMGYTDLSCYGSTQNHTPCIDQMAREGVRFTRAYCTQSICTPSRAGILTGRYAQSVGLGGAALWWNAQRGLDTRHATLSSVLSDAGYTTAMFGKWHLGSLPQFMPNAHGFDTFEGIPYSNSMWSLRDDGSKEKFPPLPYYQNHTIVDFIDTHEKMDNLTQRLTQGAVKFIREHAADSHPFFLYLAHPQPHVPLGCSAPFKGKNPAGGLYADVISELDASTGAILQQLKEYHIDTQTIVIFTSDNGPWLNYGNHAGRADGLREGKGTCFEGGFRVPCIIRYPQHIRAGSTDTAIFAHLDFAPTLYHYAQISCLPTTLNGFNFAPFLEGKTAHPPRTQFSYYGGPKGKKLQAETHGTHKDIFPHTSRSYTAGKPQNNGKAGTTRNVQIPRSRYCLETDSAEKHNIFKESTP